jgi:hypothetical protein
MALTKGFNLTRRGAAMGRADFGYPAAPGAVIWRGGIMGLNASGQLQPIQTAAGTVNGVAMTACVAFAGVAMQDFNNSAVAAPGPAVVAGRQCYALVVPGATFANIGSAVYATDDATLTLTAPTSGFEGAIGTLVGIDNGATFVNILGS